MNTTTSSIYVVVSQTGTPFSQLLKICTRAPYNHVSLALDERLSVMYSFARREINRPWIAGLIREHPLEGCFLSRKKLNVECMRSLLRKINTRKWFKF